jgi:broad specificity polyphosphatase/5'/3'-nucleotidase SurE
MLVQSLNQAGHKVVAFAPHENNSAAGMRINLGTSMELRNRKDLISQWGLNVQNADVHLFELHGTPCDTMIVALDGGLEHAVPGIIPQLVVSGVNLGPNMSQDSYHSGTMGAAREAGLYGMPAIASSFTSFDPEGMERAIEATVDLVGVALEALPLIPENLRRPHVDVSAPHISRWPMKTDSNAWDNDPKMALRNAFRHGELMLNLNVPPTWNGEVCTTRLGMRWYRNAVTFNSIDKEDVATFTIGASSIDHTSVEQSDCDVVLEDKASVSCLPTWPQTHPLALDDALLTWSLESGADGYPAWLYD